MDVSFRWICWDMKNTGHYAFYTIVDKLCHCFIKYDTQKLNVGWILMLPMSLAYTIHCFNQPTYLLWVDFGYLHYHHSEFFDKPLNGGGFRVCWVGRIDKCLFRTSYTMNIVIMCQFTFWETKLTNEKFLSGFLFFHLFSCHNFLDWFT